MTTMVAPLPPRGTMYRSWLAYAAAGLALLSIAAGVGTLLVSGAAVKAIWVSAAIAYLLQLIAFGALVLVREQTQLFMAGYLAGMALRFGALGGVAWWLSRSAALPREAAMVSLAAFVFLLLLLEPVFLRWDKRKT
ncbi:MAG: hypothetical protein ACRENP_18035 [Longimicrobiales bacterium]